MSFRLLGALAPLLLAGCAALTRPPEPVLPEPVRAALAAARLPEQALAVAVRPLDHAGPGWGWQAGQPMQPGSAMKLVTSAVALDKLGPNHRGFTELASAAPIEGDVLAGHLLLRGGGDVELGLPQLWALLLELREQGVRVIAGDVLLDRTRYQPARSDIGLPPFDEAPEFAYNVIPDALHLAGSLLPLELREQGGAVAARAVPALPGLVLDASAMTLNDARCADWDDHWQPFSVTADAEPAPVVGATGGAAPGETLRVRLAGAFPRGCVVRTQLQLIDRDALAERLLRRLWQDLGGEWRGRVRALASAEPPPAGAPSGAAQPAAGSSSGAATPATDPAAAQPPAPRVLARRVSRPWGELLRHLNKASDNAWTRVLYLELGATAPAGLAAGAAAQGGTPGAPATPGTPSALVVTPGPSTAERAAAVVRGWFAEQGVDATGLVMDNGSGLSRSERISADALAGLLQAAWRGPHRHDLLMSLPTAGVDGTLRRRLVNSPAAGWSRLKTGTLRNVRALAGVVRDADGRHWALAAMVNSDEGASRGTAVLDALVDHLARQGGNTPP